MGDIPSRGSPGFLRAFAVMSLACVGAGCWVAAAHGVPAEVWARNLGAWIIGFGLAALVARTAGSARAIAGFLLAAPVGLIATLLSPGLSGVHRWALLGPVRMNLAEILLPAAVVAFAALGPGRLWSWLVAAAVATLLVAQPDASQATAFGCAWIAALLLSASGRGFRWGGVAAAVAAITAAWLRPDPLAPVPEVEGIFRLAWMLSPPATLLAGAVLGAATLTPVLAMRRDQAIPRTASMALIVYFLLSALSPTLGAFPVPLVGMGMSPILGFWLGAGLLAAVASGRWRSLPSP